VSTTLPANRARSENPLCEQIRMNDQASREFPYRPDRAKAVGLFLLALCGACGLVYHALVADMQAARVFGIQLNATQGQLLMWALATLSLVGVVLLGLFALTSFCRDSRIVFTLDCVTLPKLNRLGLPCHNITLPFDQIVSVRLQPFLGKELMLKVVYQSGRLYLFSNMFLTRDDFHTVARMLSGILAVREAR
jgi:hypothetical protein